MAVAGVQDCGPQLRPGLVELESDRQQLEKKA